MWAEARFHHWAWLAWLACAMLAALSARNPVYLAEIVAVALLVGRALRAGEGTDDGADTQYEAADPARRGRGLLIRAVVGLTVGVALLKGISLHTGATVLFELPENWPVIGGPITLEALVSSGLDALQILAVLAVFAAFSAGADYYAILRAVPAFMHQVAMITSIAITFVPQTVTRFAEIREAQALRGHRIRRVGDLLPLIMPLLSGGMERSINLAEAMEARGFSRSATVQTSVKPIVAQIGIATGILLVLLGGGGLALGSTIYLAGWVLIAAGVGVVGATLKAMGRGARRTRYRRDRWRDSDTLLAAISTGTIAFMVTYRIWIPSILNYYPFPVVPTLRVDPVLFVVLLGLTAPALSRGLAHINQHKRTKMTYGH